MKLLICVINRVEKLEPVLKKLEYAGFRGATVLPSRGMAMTLSNYFGGSFLGSLQAILEPDREENKTIFMVLHDEDVQKSISIIESEAGNFDEPNTGVAFTLPVDYVKGIQ